MTARPDGRGGTARHVARGARGLPHASARLSSPRSARLAGGGHRIPMPSPDRWLAELPSGIPTLSGSYGIHTGQRMAIPGLMVFSDWDLWYVERGRILWQLPAGGAVTAQPGDFLLLPPHVPMRTRFLSAEIRHWFCHFSFRPLPILPPWRSLRVDCFATDTHRLVPMLFSRRDAPDVWRTFRDILALDPEKAPGEPWRLERGVIALVAQLAGLARRLRLQPPQDGRALSEQTQMDPRLVAVFNAVVQRPQATRDLGELARKAGCSLRHLERICRTCLGRPLGRHLVEIRLQHAMRLLLRPADGTPINLKEASRRAGFPSPKALAYAFRRRFGVAPRDFRRLRLQE